MVMFNEMFQAYLMDKDGRYGEPIIINSEEDLKKVLDENVETTFEIRVVGADDSIVFHVIDQTLEFPIPPHGSKKNKWDKEQKKFRTVE